MINKQRNNLVVMLCDHAAFVMPEQHKEWAKVMAAEVQYVDDPVEALLFAVGCVWSSYIQRIRSLGVFEIFRYLSAFIALAYGCLHIYLFMVFGISSELPIWISAERVGELVNTLLFWQVMSFLVNGLLFIKLGFALHRWQLATTVTTVAFCILANLIFLAATVFESEASFRFWLMMAADEGSVLMVLMILAFIAVKFSKPENSAGTGS